MAWFKRKPDPISARQRALNHEIANLEAQIKRLGAQLKSPNARAILTPPGEPHSLPPQNGVSTTSGASRSPRSQEPIFEHLEPDRLKPRSDLPTEPALYNELGVRKYDLPAFLRRLKNHFRGPSATNPKLVSYLAAGGIQGLRPLRYEKRVARNRFLVLVLGLFLVLLGLIWTYMRHYAD